MKRMTHIDQMLIPIGEMHSAGSNHPGVVPWWGLATLGFLLLSNYDVILGRDPIGSFNPVRLLKFSLFRPVWCHGPFPRYEMRSMFSQKADQG